MWADEISFKIDGVTITSGTQANSQTYTYSPCLAPGSHFLLLLDSFGDGWHGGYVRINNVNYGTTFTSGASMSAIFYIGPAPPPAPAVSPPVASPPSRRPPLPLPSLSPPVTSCPAGRSSVPVQLFTQMWADEISFKIDGVTITSGTLANSQTYTYSPCLAPGSHTLLLLDSFGDGWHGGYVKINNVNYGTTFTSGASMTFTFNV
jgi:hypothetical protein